MVARLDVGDLAADLIDNSSGLMSEHGGRRKGIQTIDEMEIAMADAARDGADQDLALARLIDLNVFNRKGLVRPVKYCGFHRETPCYANLKCARASGPLIARNGSCMYHRDCTSGFKPCGRRRPLARPGPTQRQPQIGRMLAFVLTVVDHEPKADVKESAAEALPALALTVLAGVLKLRS